MNTLLRTALVAVLLGTLAVTYGCVRSHSHGYAQATIVEYEPQPVYGYYHAGNPYYSRPPVYYTQPRPHQPVYQPPVYRHPEPHYPGPGYQTPTPRPQPPRQPPAVRPGPMPSNPATPAPHGSYQPTPRSGSGSGNHGRGN